MSTQLHYFAMSTPARCRPTRFLAQHKWIISPRRQKTCLQRQGVSMPFSMLSRPLKVNSNSSMEPEPSQQQQPPPSMSTNAAGETRQQQPPPSLSMSTEAAPTVEEVISSLRDINDPAKLDVLILTINNVIQYKSTQNKASTSSQPENEAWWTSVITSVEAWWTPVITSVEAFLKFVDELLKNKEHVLNFGESTKVFTEILQCIGKVCWIVGRLSGVAYLVQKVKKVSENQSECLRLLQRIKMLASSVKDSSDVIPKEDDKLKNAVALMVKGTIMCILQMNSHKLFRFLKTSVNAKKLNDLLVKIEQVHDELTLATTTNSAKQQPRTLPVSKPEYPKEAVGIEVPEEKVKKLLKMTPEPEHEWPLAVVIYGFGGIGKTTLAHAVVAKLDLNEYQYARVYFDQDQNKNDLKEMQKQILKDAFPKYQSRQINLRDCHDGREHLQNAFQCPENKPIFLFIDNALRPTDLAELLPRNLECLPKRSRMLLTTRKLDVTDILSERGLQRVSYLVPTLQNEKAVEILCMDIDKRRHMDRHMARILQICGGVPLALKIVGARLKKMDYDVEKCSQILDALEKGKDIKEEDLSERVVHFVYKEFEKDTKDAFLDICCFFNGWYRRHVEYVVGAEQVKSLEEAALLTLFVVGNDEYELVNAGEQTITVHDIVRAKGRNMSESTRIMDLESWREAAQDEAMLKEIKGVWFGYESPDFELEERHLSSTAKKLRILHLEYKIRISGQSGMKFGQLRYLSIDGRQLPMKFEALHSLGVYDGPLFREGVSLYKELPKKLSMIISENSSVEEAIPNSSVLKELHLVGRNKLPGGFQNLSALKILILVGCSFEELAEEVCRLSSLEKLSLRSCRLLKRLPESFGSLTSLTHLELNFCCSLKELPPSFGRLGNLQQLHLRGCERLKELPGGGEKLTALNYIDVRGCDQLNLDGIKRRENVQIDWW